jgi:hypothetical protein
MMNFTSWDVISGIDSGRLVLVLDVPAAHRAYFAELAAGIAPDYTLLRAKLPPLDWAGSHVDFWCGDIQRDNLEVLAVLGYRVGGVYAAAIADRIAQTQAVPSLILVEPQFASVALLVDEFKREIRGISSLLADDELKRAAEVADAIAGMQPPDIPCVGAEIRRHYRELTVIAFERAGLGDACGNTAITSFEPNISCLCETAGFDPHQAWANAAAIVSSAGAGVPGGEPLPRLVRRLLDSRHMLSLDAR